jgi:hypothetical protein
MNRDISFDTSKRRQTVLAAVIASMLLSACGGGGGSDGTVPTTPVTPAPATFTSWSAVPAGSTMKVPGQSQEISRTIDPATGLVTGFSTPTAVDTAASAFTFNTNSSNDLTQAVITTPAGTLIFDTTAGDTLKPLPFDPTFSVASWKDGSTIAIGADPAAYGWEYQSFGVWDHPGSTGTAGVMSIGAPTAGASLPFTGSASYSGKSVGYYVSPEGAGHTALSNVNVNADFSTRTLLLLTSSSTVTPLNHTTTTLAPNLDLIGTLTYTAGQNAFSGTLSNGGTLSGQSTGRFYGPNAEELGGVFTLKAGSGVESYGGAYGAKKN